jgi:hypothetical protein
MTILDGNIEITPAKGDIVRHLGSGTEYVFYNVNTKRLADNSRITYPTWLMEDEDGYLSDPFIVLGGFDSIEFVERGAPREPGEKPVRPLVKPTDGGRSSTITARPGRL